MELMRPLKAIKNPELNSLSQILEERRPDLKAHGRWLRQERLRGALSRECRWLSQNRYSGTHGLREADLASLHVIILTIGRAGNPGYRFDSPGLIHQASSQGTL